MKKTLGTILNIFCVVVIAAAILILITVVTTPKGQPPQVLGYSGFRVLTGSMEPTIRTDSFVLVKHCGPEEIRAQDVISFYSSDVTIEGSVNTHRVLEVLNEGGKISFVTKGDANVIADKTTVPGSDLIGKVVAVSYIIGRFIRLISNPIVFALIIGIPLLVIIITNIRGMARDIKTITAEEIAKELEQQKQAKAAAQSEAASEDADDSPNEPNAAPEGNRPEDANN